MKKGISVRVIILILWVFAMVLPLYSFTSGSASFRAAFDSVFQTQASHIAMHMFLYGVLAYLVASILFKTTLSTTRFFLFLLMAVVAVALLQESIQMISEDVAFGFDEIFDVFVDLGGGAIGTVLYVIVRDSPGRSS